MRASPSRLWQTAWALPFAWKAYGKMHGQPKTCMLTEKLIMTFMLAKIWHSVTFNLKGFWLYTFSGLRMQLTKYVVSAPLVTYQHHMPSVPIINVLVLGTYASDIIPKKRAPIFCAISDTIEINRNLKQLVQSGHNGINQKRWSILQFLHNAAKSTSPTHDIVEWDSFVVRHEGRNGHPIYSDYLGLVIGIRGCILLLSQYYKKLFQALLGVFCLF